MNRYFGSHTLEGEWHALLPRYLSLADRIEGARVLDIGCGSGLGASLLLELGARAVDAIDHRPAVLELARMKHAKQDLDFHVMLWEELDFEEDTFDLILCMDPSSPVTDPNLLREVRRVLKPGGQYVCAIERKTVQGIETLLPRYGYAEMAEQIELNESGSRVPQVGELSRHFDQVYAVTQRPYYSFVFMPEDAPEQHPPVEFPSAEPAREEQDEPGEAREQAELQAPDGVDGDLSSAEVLPTVERQVSTAARRIDSRFCDDQSEQAGVELWFCGDDALEAPRITEIPLPYYRLVERLKLQVHALQARQREPHTAHFDELLEEGTEAQDDHMRTMEIERPFLDEITQVKQRPSPQMLETHARHQRASLQMDQLDANIESLQSLYRRVQTDFERILFDVQAAFDARHAHLDLVMSHQAASSADELGRLHTHVSYLEQRLAIVSRERDELHQRLAQRDEADAPEAAAAEEEG